MTRQPRQLSQVMVLPNGCRAALTPRLIGWRWSINRGDGRGPIRKGWAWTRKGAIRAAEVWSTIHILGPADRAPDHQSLAA